MPRAKSLFQFKRGDHTCVFYENEDALLQVLTPYIADGLRNGERCFCVQKSETVRRLDHELRFIGIDIEREMARGALEFHTEQDTYFSNGKFEPQTMMAMLTESIETSAKLGFKAFRTAGELAWAAKGSPHLCDQLVEYEEMVDAYYPGQPAIGICQYPVSAFPPEVLQSVLSAHRQSLEKPVPGSNYISLKIGHGYCQADITANLLQTNPQYFYVVKEKIHDEFLGWGCEMTLDHATARVEALLGGAANLDLATPPPRHQKS